MSLVSAFLLVLLLLLIAALGATNSSSQLSATEELLTEYRAAMLAVGEATGDPAPALQASELVADKLYCLGLAKSASGGLVAVCLTVLLAVILLRVV